MDITTALPYLYKMGEMENKTFVNFSKDIWKYLLEYQIMVTAEYFPSQLNAEANWQSRSCKEPSEYKLCPKVF